jgi:hypothetical protein
VINTSSPGNLQGESDGYQILISQHSGEKNIWTAKTQGSRKKSSHQEAHERTKSSQGKDEPNRPTESSSHFKTACH